MYMEQESPLPRFSLLKILAAILFITLPFIGFWLGIEYGKTLNSSRATTSTAYYENLKKQCNQKQSKGCCLSSVATMEAGGYKIAESDICPNGYKKNTELCIDSYTWCEAQESLGSQPATNDTSTWKTYRNEEYGFEFKYPKEYELVTLQLKNPTTSLRLFHFDIWFETINKDEYVSYPMLTVINEELKNSEIDFQVEEKMLKDYQSAEVIFEKVGGNQIKKSVFVKHPHNNSYIRFNLDTFSMTMPLTPSPVPKHIPSEKDFDQILSTFRFLEEEDEVSLEGVELITVHPDFTEIPTRGSKDEPYQFAYPITVAINPTTSGTWEPVKDDVLRWRLQISSPGAKSLNFGFTKYYMPQGGRLSIYTPDKSTAIGPFTEKDNETHNQLWTPTLPGDEAVLEVTIPETMLETECCDLELELTSINHGYR